MGNFIIQCKSKEVGKQLMEYFRKMLVNSIETNGRESAATVKLSQELDNLIVREQIKLKNLKGC